MKGLTYVKPLFLDMLAERSYSPGPGILALVLPVELLAAMVN